MSGYDRCPKCRRMTLNPDGTCRNIKCTDKVDDLQTEITELKSYVTKRDEATARALVVVSKQAVLVDRLTEVVRLAEKEQNAVRRHKQATPAEQLVMIMQVNSFRNDLRNVIQALRNDGILND